MSDSSSQLALKSLLESVKILSDQIRNLSKSQRAQLRTRYALVSARSNVLIGASYVLLLLAFSTFAFTTTNDGMLDSLWFWFATLSTIGFGDQVPQFSTFMNRSADITGISKQHGIILSLLFYLGLILLGVVFVANLLSSAIEYVSVSSIASEEETANDELEKWRAELRVLHGRRDISSDNQSIDLVFQMIDHEDDSPSFTINRREITLLLDRLADKWAFYSAEAKKEARHILLKAHMERREHPCKCCGKEQQQEISYFEFFQRNQRCWNSCCHRIVNTSHTGQENIKTNKTDEEVAALRDKREEALALLLKVKDTIPDKHEMDRETFRRVIRSEQVWERRFQHVLDSLREVARLLLILLAMGWMFSWQEGWNFSDSVYFVFTTASTIGFGDFGNFYNETKATEEECAKHGVCTFVGCPVNASNSTECLPSCQNCTLSETGQIMVLLLSPAVLIYFMLFLGGHISRVDKLWSTFLRQVLVMQHQFKSGDTVKLSRESFVQDNRFNWRPSITQTRSTSFLVSWQEFSRKELRLKLALNSKVVQRLEDIMNPIRGCHEQHSVEELLHHMQLQAHEDGEFTTAELVNEEKAGDCACFSVANMHTIRAVLREEARNYRISWGDPPDAARRERAWMVAVLRNAWVHDTSDDTQWCPLVDDGLMTARFVNSSQVQHGIFGATVQDCAVQIVEVVNKKQKECACQQEENLQFVKFTAEDTSTIGESKHSLSPPHITLGTVVRVKNSKSENHGDVAVVTNAEGPEIKVFLSANTKAFEEEDLEIIGRLANASPTTLSVKDQVMITAKKPSRFYGTVAVVLELLGKLVKVRMANYSVQVYPCTRLLVYRHFNTVVEDGNAWPKCSLCEGYKWKFVPFRKPNRRGKFPSSAPIMHAAVAPFPENLEHLAVRVTGLKRNTRYRVRVCARLRRDNRKQFLGVMSKTSRRKTLHSFSHDDLVQVTEQEGKEWLSATCKGNVIRLTLRDATGFCYHVSDVASGLQQCLDFSPNDTTLELPRPQFVSIENIDIAHDGAREPRKYIYTTSQYQAEVTVVKKEELDMLFHPLGWRKAYNWAHARHYRLKVKQLLSWKPGMQSRVKAIYPAKAIRTRLRDRHVPEQRLKQYAEIANTTIEQCGSAIVPALVFVLENGTQLRLQHTKGMWFRLTHLKNRVHRQQNISSLAVMLVRGPKIDATPEHVVRSPKFDDISKHKEREMKAIDENQASFYEWHYERLAYWMPSSDFGIPRKNSSIYLGDITEPMQCWGALHFTNVAREWAVVQVVPKDSKAVEDATASWVAKILRRAAKEDSGCHRESGLKLDRVWKDKNEGILFAEIVRTLPPPLRQFTPLISTLESKAMYCPEFALMADLRNAIDNALTSEIPWKAFDVKVIPCVAISPDDMSASKFVDEIEVMPIHADISRRCCGCKESQSTTLRHLKTLRGYKGEINAIMGPLGFDNHGHVVDVGVVNKRVKVVVKDEYRWLESRNLSLVDSPDVDAKWFPEDLRIGDKVKRANEAPADTILDNGRVGDVVAVARCVLVAVRRQGTQRLWWYPESMLEPAPVTHVRIQGLSAQHEKLNVQPSTTPADILQQLDVNLLERCFIYRQRVLANHRSLVDQRVQNNAILELSERECCAYESICRCRGGVAHVRSCMRSRCCARVLSQRNLANNGMYLRLMSFLLVLICYVLLVALLFYHLEREQEQKWTFVDAFYFTWVLITTVGYGDLSPHSTAGRLLLIPVFTIGAIIMINFLGVVQQSFSTLLHSIVANFIPWACFGGRALSSAKVNWIKLALSILLLCLWIFLWLGILSILKSVYQIEESHLIMAQDFIYASVITFTTIGYGDKRPTTQVGKGIWFLYMVPGLALMAVLLGNLDTIIRGHDSVDKKKKDAFIKKRLRDLNGINNVALKRTFRHLERHVERLLAGSDLHQKVE